MQDTELFLSLAEIAGVFVGFGALIAIRSGATLNTSEVTSLRWVMSSAIWVVVAAITPIIVSRYGVTGHQLWLACSPFALLLMAVMLVVNGWSSENRAELAAALGNQSRAEIIAVMGTTFWLPTAALAVALAIVLLGLFPNQEQALYLTAVGLGLFMGAFHLFVMVFWQRRAA